MIKVPPLSQSDPRWKDVILGQADNTTIGKYGCLLTCMAMVANGYGFQETPETMNAKLKTAGGFQGALVIPAVLPKVLPGIRYKKYIQSTNPPAPMGEIDVSLAAGNPVIVEVDYSPAAGMQNHWVVLYARKGDDYLLQDPWPYPAETKEVTLTSRYGFAGKPHSIVKGAIWFESDAQPRPATSRPKLVPKPIPAHGFAVYATADGLALRDQPFVAEDNLIKRVPLQARMFALEPEGQVKSKIGKFNEWVKVQETSEGYEGYAAAWYLSTNKETLQPVAPASPASRSAPALTALVVYATADGLALRSRPQIADTTLIMRLPLNAELAVEETASQARSKIGATGQWLKVRDVSGEEGYVAAWYVATTRQDPALGVHEAGQGQPSPSQPGVDKDRFVVRTIEDGLALRRQPVISEATLIKRFPLHAELYVLEPANQAERKLGVVHQWLKVRDIQGDEGYVAAWYVVKNPPAGNP